LLTPIGLDSFFGNVEYLAIVSKTLHNQIESNISFIEVNSDRGIVGDRMQQAPDKSNFSIIVTNSGVEDSSENWQDQCQQLFDSIAILPEGSIKPSETAGAHGDRVDLATLFSILTFVGITKKIFIDIILPGIKVWLEYRPTAEIDFKCPD
jgi:hypothetical protein